LLEGLLAGARSLALVDRPPIDRTVPTSAPVHARSGAAGWTVDGEASSVWLGERTESLLVVAATASGAEILLFVPRGTPGLRLREFATVDGGRGAHCALEQVRVSTDAVLIAEDADFASLRRRGWDLALLMQCAECIGITRALLQRTAEYLAARKQFNQPLAKFQVLRHRLADVALGRLRAEALLALAIERFQSVSAVERQRLVAAATCKALQSARFAAEQAVHLHGGMGVSEEVPVGRYLRRVLALEATLGTPEFHMARFGGAAA
jgi:alkylation response protein AidB-like acyl-CoA dehydrogenase